MAENDDILQWLSQQMQGDNPVDVQREVRERTEELERTTNALLASALMLQLALFIESHGQEHPFKEQEGDEPSFISFVSIDNKLELDSWKPTTREIEVCTAKALKYYEDFDEELGYEKSLKIVREQSNDLGPNQVYLRLTKRFDPQATTVRGLLEIGNVDSGQPDRVTRLDLITNPSTMRR